MAKKLEGNGMWESSRMMLPEHKAELNRWTKVSKKRERIELADHEIEEVTRALAESFQARVQVRVLLYDEYEQAEVIGVVERIDQYKRRFMVDGEWFWFADNEGARIDEAHV